MWVSHSSIKDYLACPRAYFLRNVYRDPKTNHKITVMQPPLALGQAVHEVIESLSVLPQAERFSQPLLSKFDKVWEKISGEKGGFKDRDEEDKFKSRGIAMLSRVADNPGPLLNKAVKIRQELPFFWLSAEDNIILCGKIDWLEYLPETDSVNIIDFKTGKYEEDPDSLQLPIYLLLVKNCQRHEVGKASYWYLHRDTEPVAVSLPDKDESREKILAIAKKISLARKLGRFECRQPSGCRWCRALENVISGQAKFVGTDEIRRDVYILNSD